MVIRTRKYFLIILALILFIILTYGCSEETFESFKGMFPLQSAIANKFQVENTRVTLQNGNVLGVSFINSAYNESSDEEKREIAFEAAKFVANNYNSADNIDRILISFVRYKNYFIAYYSQTLGTYSFETKDIERSRP